VLLVEQLDAARATGARVALICSASASAAEPSPDSALRALARFPLPIVFAFEQALAGPLAEIALAADIRVCAAGASLRGPLSDGARARSLSTGVPADLLVSAASPLDAVVLLDAGLVSSVVQPGMALEEGRRVAQLIASRGPIATTLAKEAIWRGLGQPLEQALRFETDLTLLLQTTKDRAEGVRAFLEKRPPIFTGE
jgi:enoyl-CoA hydratase/carnithine racemase